jgi:hypothetical protein
MNQINLVEVGDTIVITSHPRCIPLRYKTIHMITRVTKTMCFSKNRYEEYKFQRKISDNMCCPFEQFYLMPSFKVFRNSEEIS